LSSLPTAIITMALSEPRDRLEEQTLPLVRCPSQLIRIGDAKYPNPIHWSKLGYNRFDSPEAPLGVLYTGEDLETAVIEVFGEAWLSTRTIELAELGQFEVYTIQLQQRFRVVNLTGENLAKLGTDANLCTLIDYETTRKWTISLMQHPQKPEGLRYHSRLNPKKINYALFGTAKSKLAVAKKVSLRAQPSLYRILDKYGVAAI
jgi:RES domain-containing protein